MMDPARMIETDGVLEADDAFFDALLAADADALERLMHEDFAIVDVSSGRVADRAEFLGAVASGEVRFDRIEPSERSVRRYPGTALVLGRTRMHIRMGEVVIVAASRYTHVFLSRGADPWRIVAAQGTAIVE